MFSSNLKTDLIINALKIKTFEETTFFAITLKFCSSYFLSSFLNLLNLKDKLVDMSDEEKIDLLANDGMLIKRPLLISDKGIFIGFKEKNWEEMFFE